MKEIPILFNGEMVRAIIDNRKTQTRRPVKFGNKCQGVDDVIQNGWPVPKDDLWPYWEDCYGDYYPAKSPFGKPGDVLWVRETCLISPPNFVDQCNATHPNGIIVQYLATEPDREAANDYGVTKATPSIHMPKWACRIKLKVKRVRVEHVQDITEDDAKAEGCAFTCDCGGKVDLENPEPHWVCSADGMDASYKNGFTDLWESIYGTWEENPWVWCCEFKREVSR